MINKVLYLGPSGSYCESALAKFSEYFAKDCKFETIESIYKIIKALKESNNENTAAIIPLENSIEGIVKDTQDTELPEEVTNSVQEAADSCPTSAIETE